MGTLKKRIENLDNEGIISLLDLNRNELPTEEGRRFLNDLVHTKMVNEEIDEIELIIIESGQ